MVIRAFIVDKGNPMTEISDTGISIEIEELVSTPGGKRVCMSNNCKVRRSCPDWFATVRGELVELITDCDRYQAEKGARKAY